jgi:hypothetical protein
VVEVTAAYAAAVTRVRLSTILRIEEQSII